MKPIKTHKKLNSQVIYLNTLKLMVRTIQNTYHQNIPRHFKNTQKHAAFNIQSQPKSFQHFHSLFHSFPVLTNDTSIPLIITSSFSSTLLELGGIQFTVATEHALCKDINTIKQTSKRTAIPILKQYQMCALYEQIKTF